MAVTEETLMRDVTVLLTASAADARSGVRKWYASESLWAGIAPEDDALYADAFAAHGLRAI